MIDEFFLDPVFAKQEFKIKELNLSYLLLNDNALFPWVILVPKRNKIVEFVDLSKEDQYLLADEIDLISKIMQKLFSPDKLNIASLGNITSQFHVHIIARYKNDKAWPQSVFGFDGKLYEENDRAEVIKKIKQALV